LNLKTPNAAPVVLRFNYDTHTKVQVDQPIRSYLTAYLLLIRCYVMLGPWSVTRRPWTFVVYLLRRGQTL